MTVHSSEVYSSNGFSKVVSDPKLESISSKHKRFREVPCTKGHILFTLAKEYF